MSKKIYPNDPCPCGSGKKYKNCCGKADAIDLSKYTRSNLQMEDFIKENLYKDIEFLNDALQTILGCIGYNLCSSHEYDMDKYYNDDYFYIVAKNDFLYIFDDISKMDPKDYPSKGICPYGGGAPEMQEDIMSLYKKGLISVKGHQVEIFHSYLMFNLNKRFDEYFYLPSEEWTKGPVIYGPLAHRGYDFLFAMTIYLEMQLGVHVYMDTLDLKAWKELHGEEIIEYFELQDFDIPDGMLFFLNGYKDVITDISNRFSQENELKIYNQIGALAPDKYQLFISRINEKDVHGRRDFDYVEYLRLLVPAICLNNPDTDFRYMAMASYPQCDFLKYLSGLICVHDLYEEKVDIVHIDPGEELDDDQIKAAENKSYDLKPFDLTKKDCYYSAVFYLADELNGIYSGIRSIDEYNDFPEITDDEFDKNYFATRNPARKVARPTQIKRRKLRLEIYQMLNGIMFDFFGPKKQGHEVIQEERWTGRYPILPWLSSGKENTAHTKLFDNQRSYKDVFSEDITLRQQYLEMEIRLTEIPVNCVEEFLIPDVYYTWDKQQQLLKDVKQKNDQLQNLNERLQKQISLNSELVRNFTHSSINYLNPDKLAETGVELQNANELYPEIKDLHEDGHSLLLQSEQESYVTRQLNTLVRRCNSDLDSLSIQIRKGLSNYDGVPVTDPIGFSLKSLLARILFREDPRSKSIHDKIIKDEKEWQYLRGSFLQNILAINKPDGKLVIDWWNQNIGILSVSKISDIWNNIHIIPDKDFYDLITEIVTEQMLNALSHGDLSKEIRFEFGQEEHLGRINWVYILCENHIGNKFDGGREEGIKTLNETLLMLNNNERGLDSTRQGENNDLFSSKAWLMGIYLKPL